MVLTILICSPYSSMVSGNKPLTEQHSESEIQDKETELGDPWLDISLFERVDSGQDRVRVTAITSSLPYLDSWQRKTGSIDRQAPASNGEKLVHND